MIITKVPEFPVNQFVKYIWVYEDNARTPLNSVQTFAVEGCPLILFHYKQSLTCKTGRSDWISHPQQCVIGQIKNYGEITKTGLEGMIAIVFYPDGLFPILNIPLNEITGQVLDLRYVLGNDTSDLFDLICEHTVIDEKIALVEHFLKKKITSIKVGLSSHIRYATTRMKALNKTNMLALASEVNMSERTFERKFLQTVGVTPSFFNRIMRFQKALELIGCQNKRPLTEIAYHAGYYDQSHFIRDFRQFFGRSPKEFNRVQIFG